ncbi:MAG: hypothetical protein ACUVSQ_04895 [Pseudanabaenaceae cyanobacterium]
MSNGTDYQDWNTALIQWAIQGVPQDTPVYLSVTEGVLSSLGRGTVSDFCQAVRAQVVDHQGRVNLATLQSQDLGKPAGVAFLALLVLAANDMIGDGDLDVKDFFTHFCRRLGVPGKERPTGMEIGKNDEESLWQEWNDWLVGRGWVATAVPGQGPRRLVNYPISQALLREADEQALCRVFFREKWKTPRSEVQLLVALASQKQLNQHLSRLLDDRPRHEVLGAEIQMVHQAWLADGCPEPASFTRQCRSPDRLWAGLYRTENRWGDSTYYLYPKALRHWTIESVTVASLGALRLERAGWFYPVGQPLSAAALTAGQSWPLQNAGDLQYLQLPAQNFWVLVPDPENPEANALASWGRPKLGSTFTLLFRGSLWTDLQRLQEEKLLQWSGDRQPAFEENTDWWEVQNCQVLAPVWDGLFLQHPELKEALQPCDRLRIALSGGLRVPQGRAWLAGHLPKVTVYGFQPRVAVSLQEVLTGTMYFSEKHYSTNRAWSLPEELPVGRYKIHVRSGSATQDRFLEIVNWDALLLCHLAGG